MLSFREIYDPVTGHDHDFMHLTHEVMIGHGMDYHERRSKQPAGIRGSIDDGHTWFGRSDLPLKHKQVAKDLADIGWKPDTQGHADMGTYTWQKFVHPDTHHVTLRLSIGTTPSDHPTDQKYYNSAEVL